MVQVTWPRWLPRPYTPMFSKIKRPMLFKLDMQLSGHRLCKGCTNDDPRLTWTYTQPYCKPSTCFVKRYFGLVLMLNVPVNNLSVMLGWSHHFLGITSTFWKVNVSKGHFRKSIINDHNCNNMFFPYSLLTSLCYFVNLRNEKCWKYDWLNIQTSKRKSHKISI